MAVFASSSNPTSFGYYDHDPVFKDDADNMVTWIKRSLGDDILSVELTKKQIWSNFEHAATKFSSLVNMYQAKSSLNTLLGSVLQTGSNGLPLMTGAENRYFVNNMNFVNRQAEPYGGEIGIGGDYEIMSASFTTVAGEQDYDLQAQVSSDVSGGKKIKVLEVFHYDPLAAYRYFDARSSMVYLDSEFDFSSYNPDTIFYILPVWEDVLRFGSMKMSNKIRRSNYSFEIRNNKLRMYPIPTKAKKIWFKFTAVPDPMDPYGTESTTTDYGDHGLRAGVYGVSGSISNVANIPFGLLQYHLINSVGKTWIQDYTLSLCKQVLGRVRSKFGTIPVPNSDITLDGESLISEGKEEENKLVDDLRTYLDETTYDKVMEQERAKAEAIEEIQGRIPLGIYVG